MTARSKRLIAFAGGVAGAAVVLLAATQPWFTAHGEFGSADVGTDIAAPSVTALAVAGLALVGAVAIAGTLVRRLLGVVQLLLGLGIVVVSVSAVADPVRAVVPAISAVTGVGGADSVASLISDIVVAAWPWVAMAGAGILILTGAWTLATAAGWPAPGSKYEATDAAKSPANDWDALSEGTDPTD